jgi:hypothetical protein
MLLAVPTANPSVGFNHLPNSLPTGSGPLKPVLTAGAQQPEWPAAGKVNGARSTHLHFSST